jgi:hypothetical protein
MLDCSPCSTVLGVLTSELRESVAFKKEFKSLLLTVQKRVLLLCYLLCHIYNRVLSVLPLFSATCKCAYVHSREPLENTKNTRTPRTSARCQFDDDPEIAISNKAAVTLFVHMKYRGRLKMKFKVR